MVLIGRAVLLSEVPPPEPLIQDEFSYLLAGQTYASFRLTNPPHPLWQHFETIHELMQPTYMSKYPPMQGLILAFGQLVFGMPWMGVLLSMGLFCGLLSWGLRAWIPPGWAFLGALLATYRIGILSYWTDSFWGGAAAAIGGVLVLGSIKRLVNTPASGMTFVFVLGAGILANSRPFEGFVFVLIFGGYLFWKWFCEGRWRENGPVIYRRVVPVACLAALPILLIMGYNNYRVTGKVVELPYQTYERQYSIWTPFIWQQKSSLTPTYRHEFIQRAWVEWDGIHKAYERRHLLLVHWHNFLMNIGFYFGPVFFQGGFLLVLALFRSAKNRTILGLLIVYYACTRVMSDIIPHYTAPAAALIYLATTMALRTTWYFSIGRFSSGKWIVCTLIIAFLISTSLTRVTPENRFLFLKPFWMEKRHQVLSFFKQQPGFQLVFVHHGVLHNPNDIWTYNEPDIDASRIVWVDSMSPEENQAVLDYYGGKRTAWILDDDAELTLRPYGDSQAKPVIEIKNPPLEPLLVP